MARLSYMQMAIISAILLAAGTIILLNSKLSALVELIVIPVILYIFLMGTNLIKSWETFTIICAVTIAVHLVIQLLISNDTSSKTENFSIKLDDFKNSGDSKYFGSKNHHSLTKKKKLKAKKKLNRGKEKFNNTANSTSNLYSYESIKGTATDYYDSFNHGVMKKKSNSTRDSINKWGFLKDKFFEILD